MYKFISKIATHWRHYFTVTYLANHTPLPPKVALLFLSFSGWRKPQFHMLQNDDIVTQILSEVKSNFDQSNQDIVENFSIFQYQKVFFKCFSNHSFSATSKKSNNFTYMCYSLTWWNGCEKSLCTHESGQAQCKSVKSNSETY